MKWISTWGVIALLGACTSGRDATDGDAGPSACEETHRRWGEEVSEVWRGLDHDCVSNDDCGLLTANLDCPEGAFVGACPRAIAESRRADAAAALAEASARRCVEADPDCRSAPICRIVEARCVESVCVTR
jgi:hypothetical protein